MHFVIYSTSIGDINGFWQGLTLYIVCWVYGQNIGTALYKDTCPTITRYKDLSIYTRISINCPYVPVMCKNMFCLKFKLNMCWSQILWYDPRCEVKKGTLRRNQLNTLKSTKHNFVVFYEERVIIDPIQNYLQLQQK